MISANQKIDHSKTLCTKCRTREATLSFSIDPKTLCNRCFAEGLERRLRARLRAFNLSAQTLIKYLDDKSAAAAATAFILHLMLGKTQTHIKRVTHVEPETFLPLSIEEVTAEGLRAFLDQNVPLSLPRSAVANASMPELEMFCTLKGLSYTPRHPHQNRFLEEIQLKYPQTYFSTLASLEQLERNTQKVKSRHPRSKKEQL